MSNPEQFAPEKVFSAEVSADNIIPRVLNSPRKYIQCEGALGNLGFYLSLMNSRHAGVIITREGRERFGEGISAGAGLRKSASGQVASRHRAPVFGIIAMQIESADADAEDAQLFPGPES